ncbi:MAG TPA: prolyl oligopeptidase family serine peptidase [Solirubrobacteraceae bacterium]|nr:prolyl oligopeptidase family serine peptidase [Solirubrobacteraceae bacterium]
MIRFQNDEFQFAFQRALGGSYRQCADVGEVLATAARITDGDADSWVQAWTSTAGEAWAAGIQARRSGRLVSSLAHFRRAATYYATALSQIAHSSEAHRRVDIWRRQRSCWEQIVDLFPAPGERISIAYEETVLPGFFFPAAGSTGEQRPLVVVNNGSYQATSEMWAVAGGAAAERGYHWLTFDGPGQQAMLYEHGVLFRPDWEAVLRPVLEAVLARPDVDPDRVAVIGVGQGGYWVARALCFENRFAAAVLDPGVVDVSTAWIDRLPNEMRQHLNDRRQSAFDREMHLAELFAPAGAEAVRFHGEPYGHNGGSTFQLFLTIADYWLGEEVEQIRTPLLITEAEGESLWPGQSRQLYDRLRCPKEIVNFTAREGGNGHCEPLAQAIRETRIFDWLEGYLGDSVRACELQ